MQNFLRGFFESQRGAIMPLAALTFSALVGFTGMAVDISRMAIAQARLANALDAAGLAVGSVASSAQLDLQALAQRYLQANLKAEDLDILVLDLTVDPDENFSRIELATSAMMPTVFMQLFGVGHINLSATTEVTRAARGMEISLVLDITGSMAGNRMTQLRAAATELVNILFGGEDEKESLFIGIVPYSAAVNIGNSRTAWLQNYNLALYPANYPAGATRWKGCVEERAGVLDSTGLTTLDISDDPPELGADAAAIAKRWPMYFYADTVSAQDNNWIHDSTGAITLNEGFNYSDSNARGPNIGCGQPILPLTNSRLNLVNHIASLQHWRRGGTISTVGMAWGWRLISPRWRGLGWAHVQPEGQDILPLDYGTALMDKVVVIMTDGENQFFDSVGADPFYSDYTAYSRLNTTAGGGRPDFNTTNQNNGRTAINNKMAALCTSMKSRGIIIYTITFGLGTNSAQNAARTLFQNCATRPEYYFDADSGSSQYGDVDLTTAFRRIADSLANLHISK